jgi:cadmium resistance protein CadD (predicted permease)
MKKIAQNPIFPVILAPVILFSTQLFTGQALFWGTPSTQFIPWWEFAWGTILESGSPLWNPWVGMGAPLAANYQTALFYPPYWIYLLFFVLGGVRLMAWSMTIMVVLHLIWAGIGTVKLLDDLEIGKLGQTVGGLAFSLSGYLVSRAGFLSINAAVAWIPWILLLSKGLTTKKKRYFWLTGLVFGFQLLAGHAQTAWYTALLAGLWITFWAIYTGDKEQKTRKIIIAWGKFIGAGMIGIMLSAIQFIPTLEYLLQSQRAGEFGYAEAMTYSFWPWRFLTFLVPDLFGNPAAGNYWGYGNYWEDAVYLGLLPIIMAVGLIVKAVKKNDGKSETNKWMIKDSHRELVGFLAIITLLSFLFALGKNTPIFPFLYRNIPSFDLFQAPTRFTIWAEISLAVLAGIAIDRLRRPQGRSLYWTRLTAAGCFAITAGSLIAWIYYGEINLTFIKSVGKAGLLGLVFSLAMLFKPDENKGRNRDIWNYIVVGLVAIDLLVAGWGLNPGIGLDFYRVTSEQENQARVFMYDSAEYDLKFRQFFNFESFLPKSDWEEMYDYSLPNLNMLKRIEMVNNFDPIVPGRYQTWMEEINKQDLIKNEQLIKLMNIGVIIEKDSLGQISHTYTSSNSIDNKLRLVGCALAVEEDAEALNLILEGKVNLEQKIIFDATYRETNSFCNQIKGELTILEEKPGYLKLNANLEEDSWIFWSQAWYPGWRGEIDGERTDVQRANYLFQAVYSPAGNHEVEFLYRPGSYIWGASISAVGVAVVTGGLIRTRKKKIKIPAQNLRL